MLQRLVGVETEYVLRFRPRRRGGPRVRNSVLFARLLERLRARIPVAPAVVGQDCWFLGNGGGLRFECLPFYLLLPASGFVEGATPECRGPAEVLRYQRAQDVLLSRHAAASGADDGDVVLLKVSHDGEGHHFGSHENYEVTIGTGVALRIWRVILIPAMFAVFWLIVWADIASLLLVASLSIPIWVACRLVGREPGRVYAAGVAWLVSLCRAPAQLAGTALVSLTAFRRLRRQLLPFLITRTIISGPGMVCRDGRFVLSPRADGLRSVCGITAAGWRSVFYFCHLLKGFNEFLSGDWLSFSRLFGRRQRLQVTVGDSNMAQHAEFLKLGTTLLVLDVIEAGELGDAPRIRRPLRALRAISADPDLRATVPVAGGGRSSALEIQRFYLEACRRFVDRRVSHGDAPARQVLRLWDETLAALEHDPTQLVGKLDWVTKRHLIEAAGADASIDERRKLDMRYHELSQEGYYLRLETAGVAPTIAEPEDVVAAMDAPPEGTPAAVRGRLIREFVAAPIEVHASWAAVVVSDGRVIELDR